MRKRWSITLVVLAEALLYLFLLVGILAIAEAFICPTCNIREMVPTPLIVYLTPGIIGLLLIVVICKQKKKGAKDEQAG